MLKNYTILYVEDDPDIYEEVEHFLKSRAKELFVATNGQEGLELYIKTKADIVVTDIQMPVMNGLDMIHSIRKLNSTVPIVVTSAYNDQDFLKRAIDLNVDGYLTKPLKLFKLHETLNKALQPLELTVKLKEKNAELDELLRIKIEELAQEHNLLEILFDESSDCIVMIRDRTIIRANRACEEMYQFQSPQEYLNLKIKDIKFAPLNQPDDQNSLTLAREVIEKCLENGSCRKEFLCQKQDNTLFWTDMVLTKFSYNNRTLINLTIRDISRQKELEGQLTLLATTDPLTGVNNRRNFFTLAKKLLTSKNEEHVYVLMIDIDDFKNVNDTYGHEAGDKVLKSISSYIVKNIKPDSIFGRLGGEEFGVICTCNSDAIVLERVENLRQNVQDVHVNHKNSMIQSTISIGISKRTKPNESIDDLLSLADTKLYEAKHSGKNRVRFR